MDTSDMDDGLWLIDSQNGSVRQLYSLEEMSKVSCDLLKLATLVKHAPDLPTFLRLKSSEYFDKSIQVLRDGGLKWMLPSACQITQDILSFIAASTKQKEKTILDLRKGFSHLDSEGNVIDKEGRTIHHYTTKEALLFKIHKLEKQLAEYKEELGMRCIEGL